MCGVCMWGVGLGMGGWGEEWSRMRHHRPTDAVLKLRKRRGWGEGGGAETLQNAVCHLLLKTGMIVSLNWQLLHSSTWMALYHLTSPAVCPHTHLPDLFVLPLGNL